MDFGSTRVGVFSTLVSEAVLVEMTGCLLLEREEPRAADDELFCCQDWLRWDAACLLLLLRVPSCVIFEGFEMMLPGDPMV